MQIAHAGMECGLYLTTKPDRPDNAVLIGVESEQELLKIRDRLAKHGIAHRVIDEPDMNNQITAISTEPLTDDRRKPLRKFQCWTPSRWERSNRVSTANLVDSEVQSLLLAPSCAGSSVGRASQADESPSERVGGSIPSPRAIHASIAQPAEQAVLTRVVTGSNPVGRATS